jgi:hypothetical protein
LTLLKRYIIVVTMLTLIAMLAGLVWRYHAIQNTGHIIAIDVDVYQDADLTTVLTDINWGYLSPGEAKNHTCYVFNSGNAPINVSLYSDAWQPPAAADYLWLSWYGDVDTLDPGASAPLIIELNVNASTVGIDTFQFTIYVVGSFEPP